MSQSSLEWRTHGLEVKTERMDSTQMKSTWPVAIPNSHCALTEFNLLEEDRCFARQKQVLSSDYLSTCTKLNRYNIFNAINHLCPYIIRLYFSHKWTNSPIYLKAEYLFYPVLFTQTHPFIVKFLFHSHYCNNTIFKSDFNFYINLICIFWDITRSFLET